MRQFLALLIIAIVAFICCPALADFADGYDAAQKGDYKTALREWKPLAKQGNVTAQINLGIMYENGRGVPQDYEEAVKWYKLAAEQGDADAQNNLGLMYYHGQGVPQDVRSAVKWFRLSAEQGLARAQNNLGVMYSNGTGVPEDYVLAHMWFNLSASNGDEKGKKDRDDIVKQMTPEQIAEAHKLARECVAKDYKGC